MGKSISFGSYIGTTCSCYGQKVSRGLTPTTFQHCEVNLARIFRKHVTSY